MVFYIVNIITNRCVVQLLAYSVDERDRHDNEPLNGSDQSRHLHSIKNDPVKSTRTKRQSSWSMFSAGPCLTSRGTLGKCTSFRSCYPYIKLPDFQYWDSWVVSMYDTCTYLSQDHRQVNARRWLHYAKTALYYDQERLQRPVWRRAPFQ